MGDKTNYEKKLEELQREFDEYKMTQGTKQELIEILERILGIKEEKDEYQHCFYKLAHYDLVRLLKAINKIKEIKK